MINNTFSRWVQDPDLWQCLGLIQYIVRLIRTTISMETRTNVVTYVIVMCVFQVHLPKAWYHCCGRCLWGFKMKWQNSESKCLISRVEFSVTWIMYLIRIFTWPCQFKQRPWPNQTDPWKYLVPPRALFLTCVLWITLLKPVHHLSVHHWHSLIFQLPVSIPLLIT